MLVQGRKIKFLKPQNAGKISRYSKEKILLKILTILQERTFLENI